MTKRIAELLERHGDVIRWAVATGCSVNTAHQWLKGRGEKVGSNTVENLLRSQGWQPNPNMRTLRNKSRASQIIALRESKRTLQEIGDQFGISRERVRQILVSENRPDLFAPVRSGHSIMVRSACPICNEPANDPHSTHCSQRCAGLARRKPNGISAKAEAAIPLRAEGLSWPKIGKMLGVREDSLHSACKRIIRQQGMNPDEHWAFYDLRLKDSGRRATGKSGGWA